MIKRYELVRAVCRKVGITRGPVDTREEFTKGELIQLNAWIDQVLNERTFADTPNPVEAPTDAQS